MSLLSIEAALLTGGASRRMGQDKASMKVHGRPIAYRIATSLFREGIPVTVLGREPLEGFSFQQDQEEFAGPLSALANYKPQRQEVFAVSCDLPLFDAALVRLLHDELAKDPSKEAAVPVIGDQLQPACALYRASAWRFMPDLMKQEKKSLMAWIDKLSLIKVDEAVLRSKNIDPISLCGANTPEDFARLIRPE
jgi:molybdopterin-guanine dinucleotide biosynthesis protein A